MNLEMRLTTNIMSDLVVVIYTILPTCCLYKFELITIGVGVSLQFIILNLFKISFAHLDCEKIYLFHFDLVLYQESTSLNPN